MHNKRLLIAVDNWLDQHLNDLVNFICKLVRIDTSTPPGRNYDKIAEAITSKLSEAGIETETHEIPEEIFLEGMRRNGITDISGPRINVVANLKGNGKGRVLTNGHIDVVPASSEGWSVEPFSGSVRNGRIYGRGSSDMKGAIGAMVYSMIALKEFNVKLNGDVIATFTTDEELGGYTGIRFFINKGIINRQIDYCISTDGDIEKVSVASLGDVEVTLTVYGKAHHSGTGWRGVNAIEHAAYIICKLGELAKRIGERRSKIPIKPIDDINYMRPGLYVNLIKGGLKPNIIPDKCIIEIDRRIIPEESLDASLKEISEVVNNYVKHNPDVKVDIKYKAYYPAEYINPNHFLVRILQEAVKGVLNIELPVVGSQGSSDTAFISALGIPTVCIGCGREDSNVHGVDENLRIEDANNLTKILVRCYVNLLGAKSMS
jgi:succinyl-diaminopimelate desuccinylase